MRLSRRSALCFTLAAVLAAARCVWSAPHLELDVRLEPDERALTVTAWITVETSELSFYLSDIFVVESAEVDGATVPTDRTSLDQLQRFQIALPDLDKPQKVRVRYHGTLQPLDIAMTHDDTLGVLPAMSSPEGSYLPGSSSWHPMFESAFTYHLKTHVPEGQTAVAPGAPSDEAVSDGIRHASFTMTQPIESIDMMVGPWTINERIVRVEDAPIRLRTYFGNPELPLADGYIDAAQRFIARYSQEIGPYPYTVFSVVSSPIPTGFGMPTLTYLGKHILAYPFIRDVSLGHEILHNWWGNGVRVDPARGNWAEGLTTFMADYAYREDEGKQAAMRMRYGWLRDYAALSPGAEQPLSAFRARQHTASAAIGYGKAAMLFYALRARVGSDVFANGVRRFWNEYRSSTASFDDLRAAFEQASEQPLAAFFDQWLDRTGAPQITVKQAKLTVRGEGAEIDIELVQNSEPFELSVPLHVITETGKLDVRVPLSDTAQRFKIPAAQPASAIQIDPHFEVWRRLASGEAPPILRDLIAAESVQVIAVEPSFQESAAAMAAEFSEGWVTRVKSVDAPDPSQPMLIVGNKAGIEVYLSQLSLAARPKQIDAGDVDVWIVPDITRKVVVVAVGPGAGKDHDWSKLGQRLRHLGRYSWVSIAKGGATTYGNWAIESPRFEIAR